MDTRPLSSERAAAIAVCAGAAVVLVAVSHALAFEWLAVLGVAAAALVFVSIGAGGGAGDVLARTIVIGLMFGPAAGGMTMAASALVALAAAPWPRTMETLAWVTGAAALTAAFGAPALGALLGGSALAGPVAAVQALGAPGFVLSGMAATAIGPIRYADMRLMALIPTLLALVVGARLGGLDGAVAAVVMAALATPLAALLLPGPGSRRRIALALAALGVLAAGFAALIAVAAALRLGGDASLAAIPAAAVGAIVYYLALRAHAPAVARRLLRRSAIVPEVPFALTRAGSEAG